MNDTDLDLPHKGLDSSSLAEANQQCLALHDEVSKAVIGQSDLIFDALTALISGGHLLIEGVPGLGKTLLVRALAATFQGEFARIQFTPDLMPTDVTGHAVYDTKNESFVVRKGPVFANLVLVDEINRAPAKTQASLLEIMQERQVTIEGKALRPPSPFMVLATQNPIEQEGTYPLPEAELDRFMMKLKIEYPSEHDEIKMVDQVTTGQITDLTSLEAIQAIVTPQDIHHLQQLAATIPVDSQVLAYAVRLVRATRSFNGVNVGAGSRAAIALVRGARSRALIRGGEFVIPDDIKDIALSVLRHRIILSANLEIEGIPVDQVLKDILNHVEAPRL